VVPIAKPPSASARITSPTRCRATAPPPGPSLCGVAATPPPFTPRRSLIRRRSANRTPGTAHHRIVGVAAASLIVTAPVLSRLGRSDVRWTVLRSSLIGLATLGGTFLLGEALV